MSKGEQQIAQILRQSNINFTQEKTFQDLRGGKFRYDFYLPDYCGRRIIIEVNGEQHYKFISAFYKTQKNWLTALERDRRKLSYALANNIEIYVLPFFDLPMIRGVSDIFQPKYRATSRWHNDEVRQLLRHHQNLV